MIFFSGVFIFDIGRVLIIDCQTVEIIKCTILSSQKMKAVVIILLGKLALIATYSFMLHMNVKY